MTVIPEAPSQFAGPSEEGTYEGTFIRMDEPQKKVWDDGTESYTAVCHWELDEFPGEDIWTRVNVMSRGPRSAFDKLSRALTGQPVGYGAVDTSAWEGRRCGIMYGFGNNPKKPDQFGVTGYTAIRQKRQAAPTPAPQPAPRAQEAGTDDEPF